MTTEHPLAAKWSLWEHRSKAPEDSKWMDQFYSVATVDTVEKFWTLWGHYPLPSALFAGDSPGAPPPLISRGGRKSRVLGLVFLRDPVPPETRASRPDGKPWTSLRSILDIETTFTEMKEWDTIWETLVLTVVGESLVPSTELNGIWLANRTRKGFLPGAIKLRLELWWSSDLDEARIQAKTREMTRAVKQGWNDWRIK